VQWSSRSAVQWSSRSAVQWSCGASISKHFTIIGQRIFSVNVTSLLMKISKPRHISIVQFQPRTQKLILESTVLIIYIFFIPFWPSGSLAYLADDRDPLLFGVCSCWMSSNQRVTFWLSCTYHRSVFSDVTREDAGEETLISLYLSDNSVG